MITVAYASTYKLGISSASEFISIFKHQCLSSTSDGVRSMDKDKSWFIIL